MCCVVCVFLVLLYTTMYILYLNATAKNGANMLKNDHTHAYTLTKRTQTINNCDIMRCVWLPFPKHFTNSNTHIYNK